MSPTRCMTGTSPVRCCTCALEANGKASSTGLEHAEKGLHVERSLPARPVLAALRQSPSVLLIPWCLYHWVDHPSLEEEIAIVRSRAPEVSASRAQQVAARPWTALIGPARLCRQLDRVPDCNSAGFDDVSVRTEQHRRSP